MTLKNKQKQPLSKLVIFIYIIAIIMLIAFVLNFYDITTYLLSLHAEGSISFSTQWYDCIMYYVNNALDYLATAVIIFCLGYIINNIKTNKKVDETSSTQEIDS